MKSIAALISLSIFAFVTGCSPYYDDFQYSPRPAVVDIRTASGPQATPVTALASVIGVHREDEKDGLPESVEVRLRLENNSSQTVTFDPHSMELTSGQITMFAPPIVRAPSSIALEPMQSTALTAFFPLPPRWGDRELNSLILRWIVQIGNQKVSQTATFQRIYTRVYYYDDPYWGPRPGFWYGGVVVIHRR